MRPPNERQNNRHSGGEPGTRGTSLKTLSQWPTASAAEFRPFQVGDRVEARYTGDGKWYSATIIDLDPSTRRVQVRWYDATPPSILPESDVRTKAEATELDDTVTSLMKGSGTPPDPKALEQNERFRAQMERLSAQAGGLEEFRPDVSRKVMLQALYSTTAELIPTAANKYASEKNEAAAYAYNTLANKLQQLGQELDQLDSLDDKANYIVQRLIMPMLVRGTQNLAHGLIYYKAKVSEQRLDSDVEALLNNQIEEMVRQHTFYMQESALGLEESITQYLIGEAPVRARPKRSAAPPKQITLQPTEYEGA